MLEFAACIFLIFLLLYRTPEPSAFDYAEESIDETSHMTRKIPKTGLVHIIYIKTLPRNSCPCITYFLMSQFSQFKIFCEIKVLQKKGCLRDHRCKIK